MCKGVTAPSTKPVLEQWRQPYRDGVLSKEEMEQYWNEGFLLKHDLIPTELLESVKESISRTVDRVAQQLYKAGKIKDLCEDADFFTRLTKLEAQYPNASVLVHKQGVLPPEVAGLWSSPQLMSAARQFLGGDVGGHPVWNLRAKTPQQEQATVPWHQDNGYLHPESWEVLQVTAWIPLLPATKRNGCMQVLKGGHRAGKTCKHSCCVGGTWYVQMDEEDAARQLDVDMERDVVTCEMPFGSVLFLNNIIPHRSLDNMSGQIRWSLDLRWQRPNEPNGFYGLKDCITMAKADDPAFQVDWSGWAEQDRTPMQKGAVSADKSTEVDKAVEKEEADRDFDTTISGPWMDRWELVHHNRHVAAHLAANAAGKQDWTFA
ncbi:g2452 [Coccomyxa viridis]|uniref:G2452 protein n=1 Tax=Coccomyxa viridis TaxID=1274662 RepID=A0ABP1FSH3_9CHLO